MKTKERKQSTARRKKRKVYIVESKQDQHLGNSLKEIEDLQTISDKYDCNSLKLLNY